MDSNNKYLLSMDELVEMLLHDVDLYKKDEKKLRDMGKYEIAERWYQIRRTYEVLLWRIGAKPNGKQ